MTIRPTEPRLTQTLEHVLAADPAVVRGFARAAADRLAAGPLPLTDRARLLRRGERLGLGRFDANLVLAVVERQHRATVPTRRPAVATVSVNARRRLAWPAAAMAVVVQAGIVVGAWWLVA